MTDFERFLLWEAKSRDTIDFKKIYVDIADDLIAGLLLSQLIYWYLPDTHGRTKLRVEKEGYLWIAKGREDWWEEIRITPKQFDRASNILIEKGVIVKGHFRFNGLRTIHIRLDYDQFMELWQASLEPPAIDQRGNSQLTKGETRSSPLGKLAIDQRVRPLTETTTETTTDINGSAENPSKYSPEKKAALNLLVPYLASISDIQDKDALKDVTLLGYEVAQVCKLDIALTSIANLKTIARITLALNTKKITQSDLKSFSIWWYDYSWQGKKGQAPTPGQLGDNWGQYEASQQMKSANSNGPTLTPEQKAQLEYFIAQDAQK